MPTLTWVGKDKVINHHHDVPFRVLKTEQTFRAPEGTPTNSTDNRIIHGDNLEALKSLLPEFEGRVNCIFIDPPYNTGNEGWVYNDALNDPKIKKWLGQVVGKEGEDLSRHDKWLCMMFPRLKLLQRLLHRSGSIWITIDDNEAHYLKALCDEIFGRRSFVTSIAWQSRYSRSNDAVFSISHNTILVYSPDPEQWAQRRNRLPRGKDQASQYTNPDGDEKGPWRAIPWDAPNVRANLSYPIITPTGKVRLPPEGRHWSRTEDQWLQIVAEGRAYFGKSGDGAPSFKQYLSDAPDIVPNTWWSHEEAGHTDEASKEIVAMLGTGRTFETPKPERLLRRIMQIATRPGDIVLDSFAGSGTTAHAVLNLNAQDDGNRRFILIEMMDYADTITAERVRRVMSGYGEGNKRVEGLGGSFDYYTVGEPLFLSDDNLNEAVGVQAIRDYVAYSEGIPEEDRRTPENSHTPYLLGLNQDFGWIFYYEPEQATSLDLDFLGGLRFGGDTGAPKPSTVVIYADRCLLPKEFLTKHGIIFKKIPRDISRF